MDFSVAGFTLIGFFAASSMTFFASGLRMTGFLQAVLGGRRMRFSLLRAYEDYNIKTLIYEKSFNDSYCCFSDPPYRLATLV